MIERRRVPRVPLSGTGKIFVCGDDRPAIACTIRNVLAFGFCLEVSGAARLPPTFNVVPDRGKTSVYRCRQKWRNDTLVGIEFDR
jgi:hypothetical protein